jgi:hypothetical protein
MSTYRDPPLALPSKRCTLAAVDRAPPRGRDAHPNHFDQLAVFLDAFVSRRSEPSVDEARYCPVRDPIGEHEHCGSADRITDE